jgi:hypothetical protein
LNVAALECPEKAFVQFRPRIFIVEFPELHGSGRRQFYNRNLAPRPAPVVGCCGIPRLAGNQEFKPATDKVPPGLFCGRPETKLPARETLSVRETIEGFFYLPRKPFAL